MESTVGRVVDLVPVRVFRRLKVFGNGHICPVGDVEHYGVFHPVVEFPVAQAGIFDKCPYILEHALIFLAVGRDHRIQLVGDLLYYMSRELLHIGVGLQIAP